MSKNKKTKGWLTDKDYNFIFSNTPRICVDLIVKNRSGVLLVKRDVEPHKNTWHIPGGRVRYKETLIQASNRIGEAEIGSKVKIKKLLGYMEFPRENQNGKPRHSISFVFSVNPVSKIEEKKEILGFFKRLPKKSLPIHSSFLKEQKIL